MFSASQQAQGAVELVVARAFAGGGLAHEGLRARGLDRDGDALGVEHFDLVTDLDPPELLGIADLQLDVTRRAAQRYGLRLRIERDDVGDDVGLARVDRRRRLSGPGDLADGALGALARGCAVL